MTDARIPGDENLEFFHQLCQLASHTPTIVITGYPPPSPFFESTSFQLIACLQKPFEVEDMLTAVREAFGQEE